ncbi:alpha/beta fold hydrolase [Amycolatopsis sp. NPDC004079]|uniref:alpha/beta hydrolase n=1 Tax=Amycolatopsis sp. NPDC004079 TaxID=3154549 RepID=UPI0033B861C9
MTLDTSARPHRPRRSARRTALLALAAMTAASSLLATSPAVAAATGRTCHEVEMPVASGLVSGTVHGTLCSPATGTPRALQILVPGGSYNRHYWDGVGVPQYSYTARANAGGYATLAIDRLGTGDSTKPLSALVTDTVQTDAIHQVIARARAGTLDSHRYSRVVLAGHSLGSLQSVLAATRHPGDVDAVVLSGYSHHVSLTETVRLLGTTHPRTLELSSLDPGYFTTIPNMRASMFDAADDVAPEVVAADEAGRDQFSAAEVPLALLGGLAPATTRAIGVPVLVANGGKDTWACPGSLCASADSLRASEQDAYSRPVSAYVLPRAGHSLAIAADGSQFADAVVAWLDRMLPGGTR